MGRMLTLGRHRGGCLVGGHELDTFEYMVCGRVSSLRFRSGTGSRVAADEVQP